MAVEIAARCGCGIERIATGDEIGLGELAKLLVGFAAPTIGATAAGGKALAFLCCFLLFLVVVVHLHAAAGGGTRGGVTRRRAVVHRAARALRGHVVRLFLAAD